MIAPYEELVPLAFARTGSCVEIRRILGGEEQVRRLHELGLSQGNSVTVLTSGTPCLLRVGNTKLSFREGDTATILVREAS